MVSLLRRNVYYTLGWLVHGVVNRLTAMQDVSGVPLSGQFLLKPEQVSHVEEREGTKTVLHKKNAAYFLRLDSV